MGGSLDTLPVLVKVKGHVGQVGAVKHQDLLHISVTNNLLPASLVHQVNENLQGHESGIMLWESSSNTAPIDYLDTHLLLVDLQLLVEV